MLSKEVSQSQVLKTKIFHSPYGTGVAILTGALRFTLATNIDDIKLRRLPEVPGNVSMCCCIKSMSLYLDTRSGPCFVFVIVSIGLEGAPTCWAVLTQDRQSKVLVANESQLFILDNTSCTSVVLIIHTHYKIMNIH